MAASSADESEDEAKRADNDDALVRRGRWGGLARLVPDPPATWWLTRFVFLRMLGLVYVVAFAVALTQLVPLVGERGLLPAPLYLARVREHFGGTLAGVLRVPTLFWLDASDGALKAASLVGLVLATALMAGVTNAAVQLALWALYLSIVHAGQTFYGFGWETLLCEAGFLSIFLCPLASVRPLRASLPPPVAVIWMLRWLAFRLMLGAGLIKLRGDPCWRDLRRTRGGDGRTSASISAR